MANEIMTYRRDSSDIGVIVRHSQERHTDPTLRHALADASMTSLQHVRPGVALSAPSSDDLTLAGPQRRTRVMGAASDDVSVETPSAGNPPEVILVKSGFKQVATRVREILYVEAARNYVRIHLESGQVFKSRVTIDRLAMHLGRDRFLRIHRGCLVNVDRVRGVTPLTGGRLQLTLSNGSTVTVARDRRRFVLTEIGAGGTRGG